MMPRLIKTEKANYETREWDGVNRSNMYAIGDIVLVLPDVASEQLGTTGKLVVTDDSKEKMTFAAETGIVVDIGGTAFTRSRDGNQWQGLKPTIGSRIYFDRFAGSTQRGDDGQMYRFMSDHCIAGVQIHKE
jgi:co-chaperonin GroES (HSP10)